MASATKTTDHEEIRDWIEEREGRPCRVEGTGDEDGGGLLRVNFDEPGGDDDDRLEEIDWDEFFEIFEESELAFLYQEETADGDESRFHKFVAR